MNDGAITVFTTRPLSSVARSLSAVSVPITRTAMHAQSSCEHGVSVIILCHARRFTQRHGTATGCKDVYQRSVRPARLTSRWSSSAGRLLCETRHQLRTNMAGVAASRPVVFAKVANSKRAPRTP